MKLDNRVTHLSSIQECEQFKHAALASGDRELASQATLRKVQLRAQEYASQLTISDEVEVECVRALIAYEEVRTEITGRTTRSNRTRQMFQRHGVIPAVERVVDRPTDASGYTVLVETGLEEFAFEAIILRNPDRFTSSCVERAKKRMEGLASIAEVGSGWSDKELSDSVNAYLEMQRLAGKGVPFTKRSYYQLLSQKYGRSEKAYEYRMQNISYVLSLLGREWLPGLKPAKNVGSKIAATIQRLIAEQTGNTSLTSAAFEIVVRQSIANPPSNPPQGKSHPTKKAVEVTQYDRDSQVKAWVLVRARGTCECCGQDAPFKSADGTPYLEVHHVRHMADGGPDTPSNTVALCPNCHREVHHGPNAVRLIDRLFVNVRELRRH